MKVSVYVKKSTYEKFKPLAEHLEMPMSQFLRMLLETPSIMTMVDNLMEIANTEKEVMGERK